MTDLIKTALLGTDDYHAFMQAVTVHGMRQRAGYVAPVMAGEGVLPTVTLVDYDQCSAPDYGVWERVGTLAYIIVTARFCETCRVGLNRTFDTVFIMPCYEGVCCEICGVDIDEDARDMPF